jgi:magnesium-protoporphyrin IX monomethyl ester (oxidative) cyclase
MAYRAKSPERAVEEFHRLAARYGVRRFTAVDNIIDMRYHQRMLPHLAGHGYDIFYETKANLRRHHMQSFADAGVRSIQPGMESFHDEMLRTLAKGNKAWMNVQILKWAIELEMEISWVFLIDVPRQRDQWYLEMLAWLPLVTHLAPPVYAAPIQFVRFSPYHADAASYDLDLIPEPAYAQVYPVEGGDLSDLAYYFVDRNPPPPPGLGQRLLVAWLGVWRDQHESGIRPVLEMRFADGAIEIVDTRACRTAASHRLTGLAARLYEECDEAVEERALPERLGASEEETQAAIDLLVANKLAVNLSGRILALAVDVSRPRTGPIPAPGGSVAIVM